MRLRKPSNPNQVHSSFAFWKEDMKLLKYCSEETGLSQSELIRRLIRGCASGKKIPGVVKIEPHPSIK